MLLFLAAVSAHSQDLNVSPSEHDRYEASQVQNARRHALPVNARVGSRMRSSESSNRNHGNPAGGYSSRAVNRYPADLNNHGGSVVQSLQQYLIYVNLGSNHSCATIASCWGNPHAFLHDLAKSDFVHVLDQYVGRTEDGRYTVSDSPIFVNYPTSSKPLTDADILAIVHAVAVSLRGTPTGYGNLYHVFLMPGQDACFDATYTICYSPDNQSSWYFCAYHSNADFNDIGHVLYTVQPFADVYYGSVGGCASRPGTPNGQLTDSTNNILSHETFEAISDPDNTAWWNGTNNGIIGLEMADECVIRISTSTASYVDTPNVSLNGKPYSVQLEYSNSAHACTTAP
jgi:hypothetical protein